MSRGLILEYVREVNDFIMGCELFQDVCNKMIKREVEPFIEANVRAALDIGLMEINTSYKIKVDYPMLTVKLIFDGNRVATVKWDNLCYLKDYSKTQEIGLDKLNILEDAIYSIQNALGNDLCTRNYSRKEIDDINTKLKNIIAINDNFSVQFIQSVNTYLDKVNKSSGYRCSCILQDYKVKVFIRDSSNVLLSECCFDLIDKKSWLRASLVSSSNNAVSDITTDLDKMFNSILREYVNKMNSECEVMAEERLNVF